MQPDTMPKQASVRQRSDTGVWCCGEQKSAIESNRLIVSTLQQGATYAYSPTAKQTFATTV